MVSGGTDQAESGFSSPGPFSCEDGSPGSQKADLINQLFLLDRFDVASSMDPFEIPL